MLRFAASPTGDMDINHLRVAIFNYLLAQQKNDNFIVRIEDGDKEHNIQGKDTEIMQILEKFALVHNGVSHHSEHLHMHQTLAIRLLEEGKAFICTCPAEELEKEIEVAKAQNIPYHYSGRCLDADKEELASLKERGTPFVIRIHKPDEAICFHDLIQGEIKTEPNEVDSFVILREDGTPSDTFASACEDMLAGVDFILQGVEHLDDAAKQLYIKKQLGFEDKATYAHLDPIVYNQDALTVKWLFEEGFIPDAIINYLLLLGNSDVPNEIFTLPEAIAWFNLENISKSTVKFDLEKLRLINREHLKRMDDRDLSTLFGFADAAIGQLAKLFLEEASTIKELKAKIEPIFAPKDFEGKWGAQMQTMEELIQRADMIDDYRTFEAYMLDKSGLIGAAFFEPLRLLLTGAEHGPDLSDIYPLIKSYLLEIAS